MVSRYVSNFSLGMTPTNINGQQTHHVPQMPLSVAIAAAAAAQAQHHHQQQQPQSQQSIKGPPNVSDYHSQCLTQSHPPPTQQQQHQTHFRVVHSSKYTCHMYLHN